MRGSDVMDPKLAWLLDQLEETLKTLRAYLDPSSYLGDYEATWHRRRQDPYWRVSAIAADVDAVGGDVWIEDFRGIAANHGYGHSYGGMFRGPHAAFIKRGDQVRITEPGKRRAAAFRQMISSI